MTRPSASRLGVIFLRVGNLTFGGGGPTIAALYTELVASRGWLSREQYGLVFALARVTPGTNLLAFCAGAGWLMLGWMGAIVAVTAVTLPSAAVVLLLAMGYEFWKANGAAGAAIGGILAAAIGSMAAGAWQLLAPQVLSGNRIRALLVFAGAFYVSLRFSMSPLQVLALAAVAGVIWR